MKLIQESLVPEDKESNTQISLTAEEKMHEHAEQQQVRVFREINRVYIIDYLLLLLIYIIDCDR